MILYIGIGIVVVIALYMLWTFCRIAAQSDRDYPRDDSSTPDE